MSLAFEDVLQRFDFAYNDGVISSDRTNVLVKNLESLGNGLYSAIAMTPDGISSSCTRADILRFKCDEAVGPIHVAWHPAKLPPSPDTGMYALVNARVLHGDVQFEVDTACIPVSMNKSSEGPLRVIELCSGGYGGWHKACKVLEDFASQPCRVLSVESDLPTAWTFAVSNAVPLAEGTADLPASFVDSCHHLVLHANVNEFDWLAVAGCWQPGVVTLSAPCQPWSTAGFGEGLDTVDGLVMANAIGCCKILRPRVLLFEQVVGFHAHKHREYIVRLLRWAGFAIKHTKVLDSGDIGAATRSRCLILALRVSDPLVSPGDFVLWSKYNNVNPLSYGVLLDADWTSDPRLQPDASVLQMASDPALLPPFKRKHIHADQVLASRCYASDTKVPTVVASYGSQHCFARTSLESRGLLCHFLGGDQGPRFWHPIEILLMHTFLGSQLIDKDWKLAYKHLGNQITIPHALLMLVNGLACMPTRYPSLSLSDLVQFLQDRHVTASTAHFTSLDSGVYVSGFPLAILDSQKTQIDSFWDRVGHQLPHGFFWTLDGFQPIVSLDSVDSGLVSAPSFAGTQVPNPLSPSCLPPRSTSRGFRSWSTRRFRLRNFRTPGMGSSISLRLMVFHTTCSLPWTCLSMSLSIVSSLPGLVSVCMSSSHLTCLFDGCSTL